MSRIEAKRQAVGRYVEVRASPLPGDLPGEGKRGQHVEIRHGVVDDPNTTLKGRRQRVAINAQTDALENEYARGRLSEAAYRAGRVYQAVLERAHSVGSGSQWRDGDRVDAVTAHEVAIIRSLETAAAAVRLLDDARPVVGMLGGRLLYLVLIEGHTLTQLADRMCPSGQGDAAAQMGKDRTRIVASYSWLFRQSLEQLATHWVKIGWQKA